MLHLKEDLKKELSKAIIDFWLDTPKKYCEVLDLILQHGSFNAAAVMLEEVWISSEGLVDKTFLYLIQEIFPYLHATLEETFKEFKHTGEVPHVSNA